MSIEEQVCSLEFSQKLKELGVKQKSLFYWYDSSEKTTIVYSDLLYKENEILFKKYGYAAFDQYSAFTTGELLKMVPQWIDTKKNEPFNFFNFFFCIKRIFIDDKLTRVYSVNYHCDTVQFKSESPFFAHTLFKGIYDTNPADALAKTILFLIENKLMGPEG
jgi:hypothetical protein